MTRHSSHTNQTEALKLSEYTQLKGKCIKPDYLQIPSERGQVVAGTPATRHHRRLDRTHLLARGYPLQQLLSKHEYKSTQQDFRTDLTTHAQVPTKGVVVFHAASQL